MGAVTKTVLAIVCLWLVCLGAVLAQSQGSASNAVGSYPGGATPITCASGNVAAATSTCTLAATSGKTTYITGFSITGTGATVGLAVSCTITGLITGTQTYTYAAAVGVVLPNTPLIRNFATPVPGSAVNTAIVVSCPTLGTGNTNQTINAEGFQL